MQDQEHVETDVSESVKRILENSMNNLERFI